MANLRVRLLAAATVSGKRSYYKPAMRSTGWPDGGAVLVKGRKVRGCERHPNSTLTTFTWLEGKRQQFENVGKDALSAWQAKLKPRGSAEWRSWKSLSKWRGFGQKATVADAIVEFLWDVKVWNSV